MKYLLQKLEKPNTVLNLESHNLGRITNQSVGQYRVRCQIQTHDGGHSFRDFGKPSAILMTAEMINAFSHILAFSKSNTTFNIGMIKGGEGINIIPQKAEFLFELRSINQKKLDALKQKIDTARQKLLVKYPGAKINFEIIADTQANYLSRNHRLCQLVCQIHQKIGIRTFFEAGNTDGDIALEKGIPTVTLGSSIGYKTHSQDEYLDKNSFILGLKQNFLTLLNILNNY